MLDQLEESNKKFISLAFTFIREESFIGETSGWYEKLPGFFIIKLFFVISF